MVYLNRKPGLEREHCLLCILLSGGCLCSVSLPRGATGWFVFVAVSGHKHLLFSLEKMTLDPFI